MALEGVVELEERVARETRSLVVSQILEGERGVLVEVVRRYARFKEEIALEGKAVGS